MIPACTRAGSFVTFGSMKLFWAIFAYLVIGFVLCLGMYIGMAKGSWWFLIAGLVAYVVSFAKIVCLPKKSQ